MSANKRSLRRRVNNDELSLKVSYGGPDASRLKGPVAQRPEHFVYIEDVRGSNPLGSTNTAGGLGGAIVLSELVLSIVEGVEAFESPSDYHFC